jgi:hypothetical protein
MLSFLLRVFAVVIFALLAGEWLIHGHEFQWAAGAVAAFVASFVINEHP